MHLIKIHFEFQANVDLADDDLDDLDEQDEALLREIEELQLVRITLDTVITG